MTQVPQQQLPPATAKPSADIYSLLLVIAVMALAATIGLVIWNLTSVYGLTFGQIFEKVLPA